MIQPWSVLNTRRASHCSDRRRDLREITDLSSIPARVPQVPPVHQSCGRTDLSTGRQQANRRLLQLKSRPFRPLKLVACLNVRSTFLQERILTRNGRGLSMRNSQQLIDSLIDAGLRIYDRDAEVGQEQGLSRSLVFANGLRFTCKNLGRK
jgi:hypothetical protein